MWGLAASAQTVTFEKGPLKKKQRVEYSSVMQMTVALSVDLGEQSMDVNMTVEEVERSTYRVLAADSDGPLKIEVVFHEAVSRESGLGEPKVVESPIVGRTLVIEHTDHRLVVYEGKRETLEPLAITSGAEAWSTFEDLGSFVGELDSESIDVGHRIDMTAAGNLMRVSGSEDFEVTEGSITLTGLRQHKKREWGTFVLQMAGKSTQDADIDMTLDVNGTALVDTRIGLMTQMMLAGPVTLHSTMEENGVAIELDGRGQVTYEQTAELR